MGVGYLVLCSVFILIEAGTPKSNFDVDYFYSPSLRSTESCDHLSKMYCQLNCENKNGVCINNKCYCFSILEANIGNEQRQLKPEESLQYALRPTLRHHIAHFCPNLKAARACIRQCMKEGKPAFCGKDHVCYCGHRYKTTDVDPKTNAQDIYNQFKDLYTKYFGPDINNKGASDEI